MNPRTGEPDLTEEQLRLALRTLRRPGWPQDLAEVLADPVRGKCVRGLARQMSRASVTAQPRLHSLPRPVVPTTPTQARKATPLKPPTRQRGTFDARKAAANDFD